MTEADETRHSLRDEELTVAQLNAIDALIVGATDQEAGDAARASRQTVCGWRNHNPAFIAELNRRREEVWDASKDRLRGLIPTALDAIEKQLLTDGPSEAAAKTALKLLELAGMADQDFRPTGSTSAAEIRESAREREAAARETADFLRRLDGRGRGSG